MTVTLLPTAHTAPTRFVEAGGLRYAYRRLGPSERAPLVLLQHFTGTMDMWDPDVIDGLAAERPVVPLRQRGRQPVRRNDAAPRAGHGGACPLLPAGARLRAGGPARLLARRVPGPGPRGGGSGAGPAGGPRRHRPRGGEGIDRLPEVLQAAQHASPAELRQFLFFSPTPASQAAGRAFLARQARRTEDRDPPSSEQTVGAQLTAIVRWGQGARAGSVARLRRIAQRVLVVNGKDDIMIPTINSYELFRELPMPGWCSTRTRDMGRSSSMATRSCARCWRSWRTRSRKRKAAAYPNISRTVHTAMSIAATSAMSPAGTAWRVFRMFTAPK